MSKNLLYSLTLLFMCQLVDAQIVSNKKFFKTLPNFVPLEGEYLFVDQTEITNGNWKEFLYWTKKHKGEDAYKAILPDTTVWRNSLAYNEPYVNYYYQHPAYHDYPVVGINYHQAQAYSAWRGARIKEVMEINGTIIDSFVVRLPTEAEWRKAALGTMPEGSMWPWEGTSIRNDGSNKKRDKGYILMNVRRGLGDQGGIASRLNDKGFITVPVGSYWANSIGIYNICGNVAEWVDNGKAMGGSWNDLPYSASLWNDNPVLKKDTTLSTLGFRCVLEIISFKRNLQSPSKEIKAKTIEKEFVFVRTDSTKSGNQDLFASAYETTNHWYNTFLREMDSDRFVRKTKNWMDYTDYAHMKMYGWHPYYNEFPVVNISYKQATHYCSWLTNKYNALPKRKFSKVKFRLPTEEEWIYAASKGGNNMYPWGGPYTRNSKGAFLANYFPLEEQYAFYANRKVIRSEGVATHKNTIGYKYPNNDSTISRNADGVEFIAKKNAYFPNEKGLYNCSGNVAEMTSKEGVSKGGGWNSHEYFIQLSSHETYSIPQPYLGFRVFMEVIEE